MKEIVFNLNEKPKHRLEHVAYLVNKETAYLIRRYIEKYYSASWEKWFRHKIMAIIRQNRDNQYIIYFHDDMISWDYTDDSVAEKCGYDIYKVTPNYTAEKVFFDINQKPKQSSEQAAYLVDKNNVHLIQQYVKKYYETCRTECEWFDKTIVEQIKHNPDNKYLIYFNDTGLVWGFGQNAVAYKKGFDVYYVIPNGLMTCE